LLVVPLAAQAAPHLDTPATPGPTTTGQVTATLASLAKSSEQLSEQLNQAQIDIATAQQGVIAATKAADIAQTNLRTAQRLLAMSISSQYKAASFSRTAALLASNSSDGYLQTVQTMGLLTQHQSQVATMAASAISTAATTTAKAQAAVATATAKRATLDKRRQAMDAEVTKYKALLATLTAAERAKFYTPVAAPTPAKVAQVLTTATTSKSTSKGAAAAIAAAKAELGKPYVYGAGGPDSFDCSGLTAWAWGAAGVGLPHNAAAQQGMGTPVNESDLQPGDLVFFGSPAYHVAIYLGGGLIIHAPTSGDVVRIVSLSVMSDYSGATRVG
jgi:cell wall-associated NlpC family hydrolase